MGQIGRLESKPKHKFKASSYETKKKLFGLFSLAYPLGFKKIKYRKVLTQNIELVFLIILTLGKLLMRICFVICNTFLSLKSKT